MSNNTIFILGSQGMLGSYVTRYFREMCNNYNIVELSRESFNICDQIRDGISLNAQEGDVVINCAGIINKREDVMTKPLFLRESISVNSVFPQIMAQWCCSKKVRFVHVSTDCVFDGAKGNYRDDDVHNATDIYGITKSCGEPSADRVILIRSSVIGESKNGRSLVEWLRSQRGKTITGYTNHIWNGVTCLELAKTIYSILSSGIRNGLFVITSQSHITKYELCISISNTYGWEINVESGRDKKDVDRTLMGNLVRGAIDEQIKEMLEFTILSVECKY